MQLQIATIYQITVHTANIFVIQRNRKFDTVVKYYRCTTESSNVFLAGVGLSVDTNFYRINVICVDDQL